MELEQKNLIFQFIEEFHSENRGEEEIHRKEKEVYEKLAKLEVENPTLKNEICKILNLIRGYRQHFGNFVR